MDFGSDLQRYYEQQVGVYDEPMECATPKGHCPECGERLCQHGHCPDCDYCPVCERTAA